MVGPTFSLPRQSSVVLARWVLIFTATTIVASVIFMLSVMQLFLHRFDLTTVITAATLPFVVSAPILLFFTIRHQQLKLTNAWLQDLAFKDSMLECVNRRAFTATANEELETTTTTSPCALLVIDADDFKQVNDKFGHQQGDKALQLILNAIKSATRDTDLIGRIGGEEFAILLPCTDSDTANIIAERIRNAVASASFAPEGTSHQLTISVGIASTLEPSDFATLFTIADQGLYQAKHAGRNNAKFGRMQKQSGTRSDKNAA